MSSLEPRAVDSGSLGSESSSAPPATSRLASKETVAVPDPTAAVSPGNTVDQTPERRIDFSLAPELRAPPAATLDANDKWSQLAATMAGSGGAPRGGLGRAEVAGYEIISELGRGGMGVVYKARQVRLNRIVALKMVLAGAHAAPEQLARFYTEAEAVAQLQHPNIVQIHEVGEHEGLPYFSLEFVDGGSLAQKIGGKPQPVEESAQLVELLALAMASAHERNIIHRDLKPANILLTSDGLPKITDFGLAKRLEGDASQTASGTLMGTPSYMAPEQARGKVKEVGALADVYSLGVILYEMLTGRTPFLGATLVDTLQQVRNHEPVPPSRLQPRVPRDLETICLKCLQKEPVKRYQSAEELADDLHRFLKGEPILARPVSSAERLWRWCQRNKRVAALSFTVLALLVFSAIGSTVAAIVVSRQAELVRQQKEVAEHNEQLASAARIDAEHNAERAREAQLAAEQNEAKAVSAQKQADQNARSAAEQRGLALEALNTLVVKVQDQLKESPATHKLKQDLLATALDGLRKVARSAQTAHATDSMMAQAYQRMGDVFQMLGQTADARQQYEASHSIVQALAKNDPDKVRASFSLSRSFTKLGDISYLQGDNSSAQNFYTESIQLIQPLVAADSANPTGKLVLATSHVKLGNVSPPDEARTYYTKALELRQELAASAPAASRSNRKRDVWITYNKLAELSLKLGRPEEAGDYYDKALTLGEELLAAAPDSYRAKTDLAVSHVNVGKVQSQLAGAEAAREHYGKALALLRPLAQGDPENLELQASFVLVLARSGEHVEAAAQAEQMKELALLNFRNLYNTACCYSLCAGALAQRTGSTPLSEEQQSLRYAYADRAVASLQSALDLGFHDLEYLKADPDLAAIRDHAGYQKLLSSDKATAAGNR